MEARNLTQTARSDNELHSVLDDAKVDPRIATNAGNARLVALSYPMPT